MRAARLKHTRCQQPTREASQEPNRLAARRLAHSESPRCPSSCPACWRYGRQRGTADSTSGGRDRTHPFAPCSYLAADLWGRWKNRARGTTDETSPQSTPRRCRSRCGGRSRSRGKRRPGRFRSSRQRRCSQPGNSPCHTFIRCSPLGSSSSPHGNTCCVSPPRAANSHSASVGSRFSAQAQYA